MAKCKLPAVGYLTADGQIHSGCPGDVEPGWQPVFVAGPSATDRIVQSWPMHNLVAHPLSEVLHWLGFNAAGDRLHDATLPEHEAGTGRG